MQWVTFPSAFFQPPEKIDKFNTCDCRDLYLSDIEQPWATANMTLYKLKKGMCCGNKESLQLLCILESNLSQMEMSNTFQPLFQSECKEMELWKTKIVLKQMGITAVQYYRAQNGKMSNGRKVALETLMSKFENYHWIDREDVIYVHPLNKKEI